MCTINGFRAYKHSRVDSAKMQLTLQLAVDRGRDSFGIVSYKGLTRRDICKITEQYQGIGRSFLEDSRLIISNHRAEPTTEYKKEKTSADVHPFFCNNLMLVHNGIIANDKDLAKEYNREDLIGRIDSDVLTQILGNICKTEWDALCFISKHVKGSYAIALTYGDNIGIISNYKPIYLNFQEEGIYFSSLSNYIKFYPKILDNGDNIQKLPPYSFALLTSEGVSKWQSFVSEPTSKAIVVCSGGLDSVTALAIAISHFGKENVILLHFLYHCNAEAKELEAVKAISQYLGVELVLMPIDVFGKTITESPILNKDGIVQQFDKGVEFAYEWVPARNLVMMSLAIAYAEAKGFGYILLGNNLEEAGAYPDNEMEFITKLQELIPNAVHDGYSLKIQQPVGNLMKHEIVKLGLEVGAPLHLTWSCYKAGQKHCGICGPCRMRKVAFQMAHKEEVIDYEQ